MNKYLKKKIAWLMILVSLISIVSNPVAVYANSINITGEDNGNSLDKNVIEIDESDINENITEPSNEEELESILYITAETETSQQNESYSEEEPNIETQEYLIMEEVVLESQSITESVTQETQKYIDELIIEENTKLNSGIYNNYQINTVILAGNNVDAKDIFQNATIENLVIEEGVTTIPESMFVLTTINEISMPSTVTKIDSYAFVSAILPKGFEIPATVTDIGKRAFDSIQGLNETLVLRKGMNIELYAFKNLHFNTVKIEGDLAKAGDIFQGTSIDNLVFEEGVTSIPSSMFVLTTINKISIATTITNIDDYAFVSAILPEGFEIPATITDIGLRAFDSAQGLNETLVLREGMNIGVDAFKNLHFNMVRIEGDLIEASKSFQGTSIDNLVFEEGVTSIPDYMFVSTILPEGFEIPATITNIGYSAFIGAQGLNETLVLRKGMNIGLYAFKNLHFNTVKIEGDLTEARNSFYESSIDNLVFEEGVTTIPNSIFKLTAINKISIATTVTSIDSYAFTSAILPEGFEIPATITDIGYDAFNGSQGLNETLVLRKGMNIGLYAFKNLHFNTVRIEGNLTGARNSFQETSINTLVFEEGVTSIPANMFVSTTINEISIANTVTTIGDYAFANADLPNRMELPKTITKVGVRAFQNAHTNFGNLVLENISIGSNAFSSSNAIIESITIADDNVSASNAFYGNIIVKIVINDGVTIIPSGIFSGTKIKNITVPNSVVEIGSSCFSMASLPVGFTMPESVSKIGNYAFSGPDIEITNAKLANVDIGISVFDKAFIGNCVSDVELINSGALNNTTITNFYIDYINGDILTDGFVSGSISYVNFVGNQEKWDKFLNGKTQADLEQIKEAKINFIDKIPGYSSVVMNGTNVYTLKIVNNGDNVSDVSVTYDGKTSKTNFFGEVSLEITDPTKNTVELSANGYIDKTITLDLQAYDKYRIVNMNMEGENKFNYVVAKQNGTYYDILNSLMFVDVNDGDLNVTISGDLEDTTDVVSYVLKREGVLNELGRSSECKFTLDIDSFAVDKIFYIYAYGENDRVIAKVKLNLVAKDFTEGLPRDISLGGDSVSVTVPADVPIFGGKNVTLATIEIPLVFKLEGVDNNVMACEIGATGKVCEQPIDITWEATGRIEGVRDNLKGAIRVTFTGNGGDQIPLPSTGAVPVILDYEISGSISPSGELIYEVESKSWSGNLIADLELALTLGLCTGVADTLTVGGYGTGKTNLTWVILSNKLRQGISKWSIQVAFSLQAKVFGYTYGVDLWESDPFMIIDKEAEVKTANETSYTQLITNVENYYALPENSSTIGDWNGKVPDMGLDSVIQEHIYPGIEPNVVKTANGTYMFMTNYVKDRDVNNASAVMYSKLDEDANVWSNPQVLLDDGTQDGILKLCTDGSNIYVVFQNMTQSLQSVPTITEAVELAELSMAVLDTNTDTVSEIDISSINNSSDFYKSIWSVHASNYGQKIAWMENLENNFFAISGTNVIKVAEYNNVEWKERTLVTTTNTILELLITEVNGFEYLVYTENSGGTIQEPQIKLHFVNIAGGTEVVFDNYSAVELQVIQYNGDNRVIWYSDKSIYSWDGSEVMALTGESSVYGIKHKVVSDENGNMAILSESETMDGKRNINIMFYDVTANTWSYANDETEQLNYAESAAGYFKDNNLVLVYQIVTIDENDNSDTKLCIHSVKRNTDISIGEVSFDNQTFAPLNDFIVSVELKNLGYNKEDGINILLKDADGNVISTYSYDKSINIGETVEVDSIFKLPETVISGAYTIELQCENDDNVENNIFKSNMGMTDVFVVAELNKFDEHYMLHATIINNGLQTASGELIIFDFDTEEEYARVPFSNIERNEYSVFENVGVEINGYEMSGLVGLKVETNTENLNVNNCAYVYYDNMEDSTMEEPTEGPTETPTERPTETPTDAPTEAPTERPTEAPTEAPTEGPTEGPIEAPTEAPTEGPTEAPTVSPSEGIAKIILCDDGKYHYQVDGKDDTTQNGLTYVDDVWFYIENGIWIYNKYDFVEYNGGSFLVANGIVANLSGLVQYEDDFYFLSNGQLQKEYTGLALYDGQWFYVENGILAVDFNGIKDYDGSKFLIAAGRILYSYSGLFLNTDDKWYFIAAGQVQTQYTGLALYDEQWFYVEEGILNEQYTGWVMYNGSQFYITNGMLR